MATEPTAIIIAVTQKQSIKVSVAMPNLSFFQLLCVLCVYVQPASCVPLGIRKGKGFSVHSLADHYRHGKPEVPYDDTKLV